jgi:hypothetical protein
MTNVTGAVVGCVQEPHAMCLHTSNDPFDVHWVSGESRADEARAITLASCSPLFDGGAWTARDHSEEGFLLDLVVVVPQLLVLLVPLSCRVLELSHFAALDLEITLQF